MEFRKGRVADIDQLVEHGEEFWQHTTYFKCGRRYSPEGVRRLCENLVTDESGFIVVLADGDEVKGFGLVVLSPFVFDPTFISGLELAYYIAPDTRGRYGVALLKLMEEMAKRRGAEFMSMITMEDSDPEVAARIYKSMGYIKNEVVYTKELRNENVGR